MSAFLRLRLLGHPLGAVDAKPHRTTATTLEMIFIEKSWSIWINLNQSISFALRLLLCQFLLFPAFHLSQWNIKVCLKIWNSLLCFSDALRLSLMSSCTPALLDRACMIRSSWREPWFSSILASFVGGTKRRKGPRFSKARILWYNRSCADVGRAWKENEHTCKQSKNCFCCTVRPINGLWNSFYLGTRRLPSASSGFGCNCGAEVGFKCAVENSL